MHLLAWHCDSLSRGCWVHRREQGRGLGADEEVFHRWRVHTVRSFWNCNSGSFWRWDTSSTGWVFPWSWHQKVCGNRSGWIIPQRKLPSRAPWSSCQMLERGNQLQVCQWIGIPEMSMWNATVENKSSPNWCWCCSCKSHPQENVCCVSFEIALFVKMVSLSKQAAVNTRSWKSNEDQMFTKAEFANEKKWNFSLSFRKGKMAHNFSLPFGHTKWPSNEEWRCTASFLAMGFENSHGLNELGAQII